MSEPTSPSPETTERVRADLLKLVPRLREAHHIGPEAQEALADLVEELVRLLDPAAPSSQAEHLAETSAHLLQAVRQQHVGLLASAKDRLEEAAARAEAEAPVATGLARRLVDALAGLGI